jgi:hypothetical protein
MIMNNKLIVIGIVATIALSMTFATAVIILRAQTASAQTSVGGASSFAPGQIIGPDKPPGTEKFLTPGSAAESPGHEALTAGIIGPELKK